MTRPAPRRSGLLVLAYHAISSSWKDPLAVTPETFRKQLRSLAAAGYRGVTFSEAATSTSTRRRVAVTFDDAFASAAEHAPAVLGELGWPATVFVPTAPVEGRQPMRWLGGVDRPRDDDVHLTPMTWAEVERLTGAGWEVGSHTRTHRRLSELPDAEVNEELERSRQELEERVGPCRSISYPWGEVSPRVVAAAQRAGYSTGSGLGGRFRFGDPMTVPRVALAHEDGTLGWRLKTAPAVWLLRSTPVWSGLEGARTAARRLYR
ncbi:MAG: polysaccharide deacetylase family protein [Actinomycetota bacterium]|nr:polysaccharide deacetylase family protein [Actinomycetota bacterium]